MFGLNLNDMELTREFFKKGVAYKQADFIGVFDHHTDTGIYFRKISGTGYFTVRGFVGFCFESERTKWSYGDKWEMVSIDREEITLDQIKESHFKVSELIGKIECKECELGIIRGFKEQALANGIRPEQYDARINELEAIIFDLKLALSKQYKSVVDRIEAPLNEGL